MNFKMKVNLLVLISFVFLLIGCGGLQLGGPEDSEQLKQEKAYMAARKEFALTLQKYNDYYATADEETKAKWKKDIDPVFRQVDKALDGWKLAIDNDWDPAVQEQTFLKLKSDLIILLVDVFTKEE